jgi:hypothetical protein
MLLSVRCATGVPYLFDIGIGASGSEIILIADVFVARVANTAATVLLPIRVPSGSRISVRTASTTVSAIATVTIHLISGGFDRPVGRGLVTTYGANSATSSGTSVDPGATINTTGAWTQLTASTTVATRALALNFGNQGTALGMFWLFDVGVGASGSEQVLLPNLLASSTSAKDLDPSGYPPLPVNIPEGSRIAVRSQCNLSTAASRALDVVLYGVS